MGSANGADGQRNRVLTAGIRSTTPTTSTGIQATTRWRTASTCAHGATLTSTTGRDSSHSMMRCGTRRTRRKRRSRPLVPSRSTHPNPRRLGVVSAKRTRVGRSAPSNELGSVAPCVNAESVATQERAARPPRRRCGQPPPVDGHDQRNTRLRARWQSNGRLASQRAMPRAPSRRTRSRRRVDNRQKKRPPERAFSHGLICRAIYLTWTHSAAGALCRGLSLSCGLSRISVTIGMSWSLALRVHRPFTMPTNSPCAT